MFPWSFRAGFLKCPCITNKCFQSTGPWPNLFFEGMAKHSGFVQRLLAANSKSPGATRELSKFISADERPINFPVSSFLLLHLFHQNSLGREVFVQSTCIPTENEFSSQLPAESVIWLPLIHGLVYSEKCECLFLMDGTQSESAERKKEKKNPSRQINLLINQL